MKRSAAALALCLVLAGCLSQNDTDGSGRDVATGDLPPLEYDLHEVAEVLPFEAESDDGMHLRGHVYVPTGEGPFPVVLVASPYFDTGDWRSDGQTAQAADGRTTMTYYWADLMDAGFAVALVSVRGSGLSEGCFTFAGEQTWTDMHHVIEALAQQPWANGNVGMIGISYDGWTQYMALSAAPPSLKAVVPMSSVVDYWTLVTRYGAPIFNNGFTLATEWTVKSSVGAFGTTGALLFVLGYNAGPQDIVPVVPDPSHFSCPDQWLADAQTNFALATEGDAGPYFEERRYRDAINASSVPMLVTNGLTNGEGHILQFEDLWPILPEDGRRMVLGQWGHDIPNDKYDGWEELMVGWFKHYLEEQPRTFELGVVDYEDTDGQWHRATQWPPSTTHASLYLGAGALFADAAEVTTSEQTYTWLRGDPTPMRCGPFQAAFISPPLADDVHLAGNFHVDFTLTSDSADGNIAAFLFHTAGTGACPDMDAIEVRRAIADLRHLDGRDGAAFPVGSPTEVTMRSHPLATNVPAGNRLVLVIGSESEDVWPDGNVPTYTVSTSPDAPGGLRLPVVEGTLSFA